MTTFQYLDEGNSEAQDRLATSFLLAQTSPGLARTGVLSGLTVTQTTTASGSVLIAAGASVVQASVGTGVALLVNDTQATLDVFTTDPMGGLPRNDIVTFDSVTKTVAVIIGTPNASPTDPTIPATACALARLRHAASATTIPTAKIDDLRVGTSLAVGGGLWTAYTPPYATAAGTVTVTGTGASSATATITFPAGRFSVAPLVICSGANSTTQVFVAMAISITTSGATVRLTIATSATFTSANTVSWRAVQMTAAAAAG